MSIVVTRPIHLRTRANGRKVATTEPSPLDTVPDRVPRVARLMALAIVLDRRLRAGEFKSVGELARRHQISQPRATQLLNLTLLAPDIIEAILFADADSGRCEREFRLVVAVPDWRTQRARCRAITTDAQGL